MVPKTVFIVPYRNRIQHKFFFSSYMTNVILKTQTDYEIYFSHQSDKRNFNRGGTKNIGFLAVKEKYPNDYKNITFVFNDVDTIPFTNIFTYETTPGVVKHYYGFKYALGGIVVMKGEDFERINGYPCFWGWGNEDNCLQTRCISAGLTIDRSQFYPIGSPNILQLFDGMSRLISKKDPWRFKHDKGIDGLTSIMNLTYTIDSESSNPNDNIYTVINSNIFYINITGFKALLDENSENYFNYDLRDPSRSIIHPNKLEMVINNTGKRQVPITDKSALDDWTYIPDHPSMNKKVQISPNSREYNKDNIEILSYANTINDEIKREQNINNNEPQVPPQFRSYPSHFRPQPFPSQQPYPQYPNQQMKTPQNPQGLPPPPYPHPRPRRNPLFRPAPGNGGHNGHGMNQKPTMKIF